jgi:hypothetical protein
MSAIMEVYIRFLHSVHVLATSVGDSKGQIYTTYKCHTVKYKLVI